MRRVLALVLLLCAAPAVAQPAQLFDAPVAAEVAGETIGPVADTLQAASAVTGRFEQRKQLAGLPRPLTSQGVFAWQRDAGVWWHTRQPFDSRLVLDADGLRQRDEGGELMRITADEQPGIAVAARIFGALFALDFATLETSFDTYALRDEDHWWIGLRPRSAALADVIESAVVSGDADSVRHIVLHAANGDRTDIALSDVALRDRPLSEAERAPLEP